MGQLSSTSRVWAGWVPASSPRWKMQLSTSLTVLRQLSRCRRLVRAAGAAPTIVGASLTLMMLSDLKRIHAYNAVNLKRGYPLLEIRTPREVTGDE